MDSEAIRGRWLGAALALVLPLQAQEPVISELMASNKSTIIDGNGDPSDWVEIHHSGAEALNLSGWHLTDDAEDLTQFTFPEGSIIPAGGYQVVFASGDLTPPEGEWHASFALSSEGEYLALVRPDGVSVASQFSPTYPSLGQDISYGRDSSGEFSYFLSPTPGAANGAGISGFVGDTRFSHKRGFYDAPFDVSITTSEPNATIRYTLDGSEPSLTNGETFTVPIPISTTTTLRAKGYKTGFQETDIDTQSYFFLSDVIEQPASISRWPRNTYSLGTNGQSGRHDYEMDPNVVDAPEYSGKIIDALKAIPTMSIVTDRRRMFGSRGFYDSQNNESRTSVELLYPDTPLESEQVNGGIEGHSHLRMKRSLRLNFRGELGASSFKTDLFSKMPWNPPGVKRQDVLILRGGNNRAWSRNWSKEKCSFCIDEMARQMQLATSGYGMRGAYVHLYINGLYWGMFNVVERADEHFSARYFGGDEEDWHARNHGGALQGSSARFNYLSGTLKNKDMSVQENYNELQSFLDVDGFIDYLLVQWLNATGDWPENNWYANNRLESSSLGPSPTRFLTWDSEWSWNLPRGAPNPTFGPKVHPSFSKNSSKNSGATIARIFNSAKDSPEFRRRFSDRAYQHLANDGVLTDEAMRDRFLSISNVIKDPVIAESARWGDTLEPQGEPTYTRDVHWQNEVDTILGLMVDRSAQFITALRSEGYYPSIDPPVFEQQGGNISIGSSITLSDPNLNGQIFYTLDGQDPANGTGLIYNAPLVITAATRIKTRVFLNDEWSALNEATFFVANPPSLIISELMYHPAPPSAAEAEEGFTDQDDFEYLEILNAGESEIDLGGITFKAGVTFTFPAQILEADERVIIASNPEAFAFRYGEELTVLDGFTAGRLANEGERLRLETALGELITEFTYDNRVPWSEEAAGEGYSLVFVDGEDADPNSAESWRRSALTGGSPSAIDEVDFGTWVTHLLPDFGDEEKAPLADPDHDGLSNAVEYLFDLNPIRSDANRMPQIVNDGFEISLSFSRALYKRDLSVSFETSENASVWGQEGMSAQSLLTTSAFEETKIVFDQAKGKQLFRFLVTLP